MKKRILFTLALTVLACKPGEEKKENTEVIVAEETKMERSYPEALEKVFMAHGGMEQWKNQRTLVYELPKKEFTETHTVDLWSRKDKVETEQFSMGSDGNQVWLLDQDKKYGGDAGFYHNLMFYFYAMPFVLADDGIVYKETDNLVYDGKSYPGIGISYQSGVGVSSKDEYFIHFDADTHQMAWLGYTVTYRTGEKSETVKWIRYDDWQSIDGLSLPKSITWYNFEGTKILDARSTVNFENVVLKTSSLADDFYRKPDLAEFVEVKTN